jgi:hypothetical protein
MTWLLTIIAWLGTTAVLAPLCFFAVIGLAGPHGGILPESLHRPVLLVAWILLLAVPVWVAHLVHQRLAARK